MPVLGESSSICHAEEYRTADLSSATKADPIFNVRILRHGDLPGRLRVIHRLNQLATRHILGAPNFAMPAGNFSQRGPINFGSHTEFWHCANLQVLAKGLVGLLREAPQWRDYADTVPLLQIQVWNTSETGTKIFSLGADGKDLPCAYWVGVNIGTSGDL